MSLANNTNELNIIGSQVAYMKEEYGTQSGLIAQIKTVLQQKASGEVPENKLARFVDGSLTEITASDLEGATSIRRYAFYHSNITSIVFPNSVTSIESYAFQNCNSLQNITIPNSVTSIGEGAFRNCIGLGKVTIPDSVEVLSNSAFYTCSSLKSITIGNRVTIIDEYVFYKCSCLTSVTIPNSVTSIGQYAFFDCTSLTNLTIPASVTSIASRGLHIAKSSAKATIRFLGTTPPSIQANSLADTYINQIIVPKGYGDTYKQATNFSNFADLIVESET